MATRVEGDWRHRGGFFLRTDAARHVTIAKQLKSKLSLLLSTCRPIVSHYVLLGVLTLHQRLIQGLARRRVHASHSPLPTVAWSLTYRYDLNLLLLRTTKKKQDPNNSTGRQTMIDASYHEPYCKKYEPSMNRK
jgi:hypothetical protein